MFIWRGEAGGMRHPAESVWHFGGSARPGWLREVSDDVDDAHKGVSSSRKQLFSALGHFEHLDFLGA